ncbi:Crp/Fnr family transcriptional regulator [Sandaracinobacter sp. RS1-74]|uniref:Crp/Fnr family transcriptional regulator n=1 Tax=Sandaracinobacteroides sayramensis TaxID=2913411 RepID=UPI001EDA5F9E|nr:Crp/Fnr family transcriptional regulator [Sandaracinobacteroides sayramensis]MCG2841086.1 Crp/Fnr family transcriptional regulator [Sandaracinobacteroides sayramensis]
MVGRSQLLQGLSKLSAEGRELLSETGWLSRMPEEFQDAVFSIMVFRRAPAGLEFAHADDRNPGLVGIASGCVEIGFAEGHPETRSMHLAYTGFWSGYKTLLGQPRYLSLQARTDVLWGMATRASMERILRENPQWWRHILVMADELVNVAASGFADLTRQSSEVRAIAVLLRLADCRYRDPPEDLEAEIRISQTDLAAMSVMSRNTFNSILNRLVEQGLLEIGYRSIILKNPAALRAIVHADY